MNNNSAPPNVQYSSTTLITKLFYSVILCPLLKLLLLLASIFILITFFIYVGRYGWFNDKTLLIAVYVVIGSYFFLIVDKAKIEEVLNISIEKHYKLNESFEKHHIKGKFNKIKD